MRVNWINAVIASILAALLAWWLWTMGINNLQKWLLACEGGAVIWLGLVGGLAISYENPRSGIQVRLLMNILACITFIACCIYSFFRFSPEGFCIPVAVFALLILLVALKIYRTKE